MTDFVFFVFVSIGVTYGLVESAIMAPYRMALAKAGSLVQTLVYCPSCTGFWVALVVGEFWWASLAETAWRAFAFIGVLTLLRAQWPELLLGAWGEQATTGLRDSVVGDARDERESS
jgi:hypothetical protein